MIKILLLKSFHGLGVVGDVVNVKPGYAKNFLIPSGIALFANKNILSKFENRKLEFIETDKVNKDFVNSLASTLNATEITMIKRSFSDGKLFGSVSTREICDALINTIQSTVPSIDIKKVKQFVNPASIRLFSHIKYVGNYNAKVILYADTSLDITVDVRSDSFAEKVSTENA